VAGDADCARVEGDWCAHALPPMPQCTRWTRTNGPNVRAEHVPVTCWARTLDATLVDEQTNVSYRDGMAAALELAEALRQAEGEYDIVQMNVQLGRMINAVKEFIPEEKWPELQARLRGQPSPPSQTG
jgi:hypothetical protein